MVDKFIKENLVQPPSGRLIRVGEGVAIAPEQLPTPRKSVFMSGVMLGEIKGSTLVPHHQFYSAYGSLFKRQERLERGDPRLAAYLRGEQIEARTACGSGFVAVLYGGAPLGGGKLSSGRINNHYPKGLRNK
jgi:NOL1/NOP2/fmu family ribosome biogenesis protein